MAAATHAQGQDIQAKPIALWQRAVSLAVYVLLASGILLCFSTVFTVGDDILHTLSRDPSLKNTIGAAFVLVFLLLYVLDFSYWPGAVGACCRRIGTAVLLLLLVATALVSQAALPYVPLGIGLITLPCVALFMSYTVFRHNKQADVAICLGQTLLLTFLYALILWVLWFAGPLHGTFRVQEWSAVRSEFSRLARCDRTDYRMGAPEGEG